MFSPGMSKYWGTSSLKVNSNGFAFVFLDLIQPGSLKSNNPSAPRETQESQPDYSCKYKLILFEY